MPRQAKGPRLYLRRGRIDSRTGQRLPDRWFIRDGAREVGTGCGPERLGEAEQALARYIAEKWVRPDRQSDPARVLVADALALYGADRGASLKSDAATMKGFVRHLLAFWGDKTLDDVRRQACIEYVAQRTGQLIRHGDTGRTVSVQTARRELEVLSAAIGHWDREHHLNPRPVVTLPEKAESHRDALTRPEAARLLWASLGHRIEEGRWTAAPGGARGNRAHLRRFVLIGLYTGTRSGVIKRLSWVESLHAPWVDLDAGVIYRRGRAEAESRTKRKPLVKLPRRLLAHMKRWRKLDLESGGNRSASVVTQGERPGSSSEGNQSHFVIHHGGRAIKSVRTGFAGCVADAGLPSGVTPHWLRHTAATWLMERQVDPWEAAGYLGMTVATLEKHYAHARPDHQSAARKAMG